MTAGLGAALTVGAGTAAATAEGSDSGRTSSVSSSSDSSSSDSSGSDSSPSTNDEDTAATTDDNDNTDDNDDNDDNDNDNDDDTDVAPDEDADEDAADEDVEDDPSSESPPPDDDDPADPDEETEPEVVAVQPVSKPSGNHGHTRAESVTTRAEVRDTAGDTEPKAEPAEPAVEPAQPTSAPQSLAAVTTEGSTTAVATTAAGEGSLVSGRVTVGTILVDIMTWIGLAPPPASAQLLPINVPGFIESWWFTVRANIYREGQQPAQPEEPGPPQEPEQPELPDNGDLPLVWETDFTSIEEALKYWGVQTGRWGQSAGENQYYTDFGNVYLNDEGHVVIVTRQEAAPDGLGAPHNYTSTRLVTYGKASVSVGQRIVARIQMPYTQGSLPAFWTVGLEPGHEFDWPRQGEIDIVELPGFGGVDGSKHWTGNIHGPAAGNNTVDVKLHGNDQDMGIDLSQGFHEYGIDWYPDRIIWHVDGHEVGSITQQQYEALGGDWTPFSGAWDHYLILNNAVGNPWTGDPDETSIFPMEMKIDWVKVYQL